VPAPEKLTIKGPRTAKASTKDTKEQAKATKVGPGIRPRTSGPSAPGALRATGFADGGPWRLPEAAMAAARKGMSRWDGTHSRPFRALKGTFVSFVVIFPG